MSGQEPPAAETDTSRAVDQTDPTEPNWPGMSDPAPVAQRGFWVSRTALVMPAVLVGLAIFLVIGIATMDVADDSELFGPKAFPIMTIAALLIIAVLLTISIVRNPEVPVVPDGAAEGTEPETPSSNWPAMGVTIGSVALFILLLETAGWIIAAAVLFAGVATGLGSKRYLLNIGVGFAISSIVQLVFVGGLGLSLPPGIMGLF